MITFVSIATNIYFEYWQAMVESFCRDYTLEERIRFVCLTEVESTFVASNPRVEISYIQVKPMFWPEATLKRYHHIRDVISGSHQPSGHVAHIDADMRFHNADVLINTIRTSTGVTFVKHPSYASMKGSLFTSKAWLLSLLFLIRNRGFGEWETRRSSAAFVPAWKRKHYVCGGFWFGEVRALERLCSQLANHVDQDSESGIVARWHDESHLNWAFANLPKSSLLGPEYCSDLTQEVYKVVSGDVILEAVSKVERTR